jgi:uncharacterized protein YjbI with pentapeptide repeats
MYTGPDLTGANLAGANLTGADLAGANLTRAYLAGANLTGANLARAYLTDADLTRAYLTDAYLTDANLARANLTGANLAGADLAGADLPPAPIVSDLDAKILAAIEAGGKLDMGAWHTCDTTHCRAGWAIVVAGKDGRELEERVGAQVAGTLIYHASTGRVPDFYASDEDAMKDIKRCGGAK